MAVLIEQENADAVKVQVETHISEAMGSLGVGGGEGGASAEGDMAGQVTEKVSVHDGFTKTHSRGAYCDDIPRL